MPSILDKIKKLVNQQKGEERLGNKAAAEAFAVKIQELLIKYKIELADVEDGDGEPGSDPIITKILDPAAWGEESLPRRVDWTEGLCDIIAKHYFCRGLALLESNSLLFVGKEKDVDIAITVFCFVMRTGLNLCEAELAAKVLELDSEIMRLFHKWDGGNDGFRLSFFAGFNQSIDHRLHKSRKQIEQAVGNCTALVRAEAELDQAVKDLNPVTEEAKLVQLSQAAFNTGAAHGAKVGLTPEDYANKQLEGRNGKS